MGALSSWAPAPLRRLVLTLVALVAVVVPSLVTAWVLTPSAADVQQRVRERTDTLGVVMLREDEVPRMLAQAEVGGVVQNRAAETDRVDAVM